MQQDNERHSLATYLSDMLALERHVRIPFDTQRNDGDVAGISEASQIVGRLVAACDRHIEWLCEGLEELGGHEAAGVKSAVSGIAGFVAGAIDKTRKTKVSKSLRDDYAALALCAASYSELLATANAMRNAFVASTAREFLEDYAGLIMEIGRALPAVVVVELADMKLDVDTSTASATRQQIENAWRARGPQAQSDDVSPRSTVGSVEPTFTDASRH